MKEHFDVLCIGGGAAGFFAAISCAELCPDPLRIGIVEATGRVLTKVKISGGGRCNVTNRCEDPRQLIANYPRGGKNLLNGFFKFGPKEMRAWLDARSIQTVAEKDGRVFPSSNTSQTIIDCLVSETDRYGIELFKGQIVKSITKTDELFSVVTRSSEISAKYLIIATGGAPQGHKLAADLGHTITNLAPSLFTLKSTDPLVEGLAGISVEDAAVQLNMGDTTFKQRGPLLITHWGFSGPAVLKLSAFAAREFLKYDYKGKLIVNWLPGLNGEQLWSTIKEHQQQNIKKKIVTTKPVDLPKRLWQRIVAIEGLTNGVWGETSDKSLRGLCRSVSEGTYLFAGKGEFKEEFVTCGGVALSEVDLKTFESKLCPGLYFSGEVLDIDGITGGFNFQNAWTSARIAAITITKKMKKPKVN